MAIVKKTQTELCQIHWHWQSNVNAEWSPDTLQAASACETARRLIVIDTQLASLNSTLSSIKSLLLNLGNDGIHDLIRMEARRVRTRDRKAKQAAVDKRRRSIVRKRAEVR